MRFGQSIIADEEVYAVPGEDRLIKLGEMARKVISEVNPHIKNALYRFHFNNTRTADTKSPHKEQRKSATYYALTEHHIPAFGVETSKFLPSIDLKVRYHNMVINAFMRLFGIVPEYPGLALDPPELKYLVVSISGRTPIVIRGNECLEIQAGDTVNVSHIEANYERGLSLDILGYGDLHDFRKDFTITSDTRLIVRRDNQTFAEIPIRVSGGPTLESRTPVRNWKLEYLMIEAKGDRILLADGETLHLVEGDRLKIVDVWPTPPGVPGLKVNFKGFVGNRRHNTGEDRGYVINTANDLMKRYSLEKKGALYEILASREGKLLGRFLVRLIPPRLAYLKLKVNGQPPRILTPGDTLRVSERDQICLEEVGANMYDRRGFHMSINGHRLKPGKTYRVARLLRDSDIPHDHVALIKKGRLVLGRIRVALEMVP
jgi:hypothetical protein